MKKASKFTPATKPETPDAVEAAKLAGHEAAKKRLAASRRPDIPLRIDTSPKRCKQVEERFLDGLRDGWSISRSAIEAGVSPHTVYDWRDKSIASKREDGTYVDDFYPRWCKAYEQGVDRIEDEVTRRAVHGVEKPVYQGGILVGAVTEYSDVLAMTLLKGKRAAVYNTERHEHTGKDGGAIEHNIKLQFVDPPK